MEILKRQFLNDKTNPISLLIIRAKNKWKY